ncbi:MAG: hypothetical protein N3A69_06455, partial [Leptospiraceae bacterium]|nr:hypothetical protein [Leptospiraceae bacterium]
MLKSEIARKKYFKEWKVFMFCSALRGDYNVMLSDIEIAIVTPCKEKEKILEFKAEVTKNWDVFELHVVDEKLWNFYKRFIDVFKEVQT